MNTSNFKIYLSILLMNMRRLKKILRLKNNSSMTKTLRKVIMHRYKLKYVCHISRTIKNWELEPKGFLCKSSIKN